jgi:hypothetical protein
MKRGLIITLIGVALLAILGYRFYTNTFNAMVEKEEGTYLRLGTGGEPIPA